MKYIYLLLKQRLLEILDLKEVLWYNGQYDQIGEQSLYVDTAAYIEFLPIEWTTKGKQYQEAVLQFNIHLLTESVGDNDERILDADVNHFGLLQDVFQKLQGWNADLKDLPEFSNLQNSPKIINSIVRTGMQPDNGLSNLIVTIQSFQCTVFDYQSVPQYTAVQADLNLSAEIDIPS